MEQNLNNTSVECACDISLINGLIGDGGWTAVTSCEVVGLRERRGIILIPPTNEATLVDESHKMFNNNNNSINNRDASDSPSLFD